MNKIDKYKPAVTKNVLLFLAGFLWACVGTMLIFFAFSWRSNISSSHFYLVVGVGIIIALLTHHLGFLNIANKNIKRILPMNNKKCVFAFIPWKGYIIIAAMMTMGTILRHSSIPKRYLVVLYIGMGLGLLLSSIRYMRVFFREIRQKA